MSTKPNTTEVKRRQKKLEELVATHGRTKIAYAAMMSSDGLRMAVSKDAPRNIAAERLMLIEYRLADETVWKEKAWKEAKKRLDAYLKKQESGLKP